jgi:hypothetical protein
MTSLDLIADHAALRWELLGLTDELTAIGTDPGGTSWPAASGRLPRDAARPAGSRPG